MWLCGAQGLSMGLGAAMGLQVECHMVRGLCTHAMCHTDLLVCGCAVVDIDTGSAHPGIASTSNGHQELPQLMVPRTGI
jgi:hypothetical protein